MTPVTPITSSPVRLFFWRVAALATDVALRNRAGITTAWPFVQLLGGGLVAYAVGRLFGAWALSAIP
ncbi:MAG: hypothetical protein NTU91_16245 [Chloroflexi bacterium]|jgi:hypothetical protein|nr:hypothetical protein [Chloroflexota bacterium]